MSVPPQLTGVELLPAPSGGALLAGADHALFNHIDHYLRIGQESDASDIHLG